MLRTSNDGALIDSGGHGAPVAKAFAMTYVRAWSADGLYVVMRGGGGGAAGEMPATVLHEVSEAARLVAVGAHDSERLATWIAEVDARIAVLCAGARYAGSGAYATALVLSSNGAWLGNVGLGRCYRLDAGGFVQLTRDDSLLQDARDAGQVSLDERHGDIVTVALGPQHAERRGWQPTPVSLDGSLDGITGFVLTTREAHLAATAEELTSWSRDAFATPDLDAAAATLWRRLRANLATARMLAQFDRRAAVMLLRPAKAAK